MCLTPIKIPNADVPVPCGRCPKCRARRISGWSFRLVQQYNIAMSAYFLTLTYDTDHVPITQNGFMGLRKRDLQLFFKKLRKSQDIALRGNEYPRIKYYAVGEYGGRSLRPHYHVILFNAKLELIQPAWDLGNIHYGTVNEASVGYTLKYISKPSRIPLHRNDDRIKEFSLMSKGLGINYLTPAMVKWHMQDLTNRMYCNLKDGKKIAMPRYYKDKMYYKDEREQIARASFLKFVTQELETFMKSDSSTAPAKKASIKRQFELMLSKDTKTKI